MLFQMLLKLINNYVQTDYGMGFPFFLSGFFLTQHVIQAKNLVLKDIWRWTHNNILLNNISRVLKGAASTQQQTNNPL